MKKIKLIRKLKTDQSGTIVLITFLVLISILTVGIGVSNLVLVNLKLGGTQARATKAFFAAEAGSEKVLWEIRKEGMRPGEYGYDCDPDGTDLCYDETAPPPQMRVMGCVVCNNCDDCSGHPTTVTLNNDASFRIQYEYDDTHPLFATTTLTAFGSFGDTNRTIELSY